MSTNNLEDEKETVSNNIPCKLTIFNYKFLKSTDYYIYILFIKVVIILIFNAIV